MAAIFSNVNTGIIYFSLFPARNIIIVNGTNIIRDTSFVTNIDDRNTENTKKIVMAFCDVMRLVFRRRGRKMFSFLKPSRIVRSIKSVPKVRQSIAFTRAAVGGVMNSEITAASTLTTSINSFFIQLKIFENITFSPPFI